MLILHGFFPSSLASVTMLMRTIFGNVATGQDVTIHSAWSTFAGAFAIVGMVLIVLFAASMVIGIAAKPF